MTERLVRLLGDVTLEDKCSTQWLIESGDSWYYRCRRHNTRFGLSDVCPGSLSTARAGDHVYLPQKLTEQLVRSGIAEYPTHEPIVEDGVKATVDRVNALMDSMSLPHLDAESLKTVTVEGRKGSGHYAKPRDRGLADSLGLDASDIADMRKLAGG